MWYNARRVHTKKIGLAVFPCHPCVRFVLRPTCPGGLVQVNQLLLFMYFYNQFIFILS